MPALVARTHREATGAAKKAMDQKNQKAARLEQRLAALRRSYVLKFPEKCQHIEQLFQEFLQTDELEPLEKLRQASHKLKGSGATYGFEEISECAMIVEARLASCIQHSTLPKKDDTNALRREIDLLTDAMMRAVVEVDV